jgi:hypothetical protein
VQRATITALVDTFEHAKTFGSLIQIPYALNDATAGAAGGAGEGEREWGSVCQAAAQDLLPLVQQAQVLGR